MAGLKILYNLILKDAARGSGQASGIMSIGDSVRKLAEKRLQSYLLSAQKQGVDLDKLSEAIEIDIKYNEVTNFPSISRDISILIDKNFSYDEIIKVIDTNAGEFLINANLVDIYTDKNISAKKHSLLFSLRFGANNRTLKDKEVDKSINNIINSLKNKFKVTQR